MSTREQFGNYLLLKKLSEDPLGETFRAGKIGRQGLDRVVLLRVYNGPGLDGPRLWQRVADRAAVHQALKSPNLAEGVDMGEVRGTPYAAYDYISGKNLATLFEQAEKRRSPFPLDHALLIGERLGQGVAVAYESRIQDERILHGFLVPHLVILSNEGETRLLGFEMAPGLREVATGAGAREHFARYLAPEALGGGAPHKADDVYSLGAILFELLTGKKLPPPAAAGYGPVVDQATMPVEGGPIPAEIAALLKKSLAPRDQRVTDATIWHKSLAKTMAEGHYNPTTFNLAFFMHNLLREEIEREAQEMAAEKKISVPAAAITAVTATIPTAAPPAPAPRAPRFGLREETVGGGTMAGAAPSGSKKGLMIGIAAGVAALLGVGGYLFMNRTPSAPPPPVTAAPAVDPAPAAPVPTGPTAEDLQKQIAALAANQADISKYAEEIKKLQKQLEDARRAPAERPAAPPSKPAETATAASTPPAATATPPAATPAPPTTPSTTAAGAATTTPPTSQPPAPAAPADPEPEPVATDPAPQPAAAAPTRFGDLVRRGPGVVVPKLLRNPQPAYPEIARRTNRTATVVVSVLVDENGRVAETKIQNKVGMGFDEAASRAAKGAVYQPAQKDGVRVKMWWELAVNFKP